MFLFKRVGPEVMFNALIKIVVSGHFGQLVTVLGDYLVNHNFCESPVGIDRFVPIIDCLPSQNGCYI